MRRAVVEIFAQKVLKKFRKFQKLAQNEIDCKSEQSNPKLVGMRARFDFFTQREFCSKKTQKKRVRRKSTARTAEPMAPIDLPAQNTPICIGRASKSDKKFFGPKKS